MTSNQPGEPPGDFSKFAWLRNLERAPGLTGSELYAVIAVFNRVNEHGVEAYLSAESLARSTGMGITSARRALKSLADRGIVRKTARGGRSGDGRQWASTYALGSLLVPSQDGRRPVDCSGDQFASQPSTAGRLTIRSTVQGRTVDPVDELASTVQARTVENDVNRPSVVGQPSNPDPQPSTQTPPSDPLPTDPLPSDPLDGGVAPGNALARESTTPTPRRLDPARPLPGLNRNAVAANRLPDRYRALLGRGGANLAHIHVPDEGDGHRILDTYERSEREQTPEAFRAYLDEINGEAATSAEPGEVWSTPLPADSPADTATTEPHERGNGTAAATAAEPGGSDGEEPDTGTPVESTVLGGPVSAALSAVDGLESAESPGDAPNAGESLSWAHSADRGPVGRAGRGGRGSTTPEERQQRALALMHTMTEDSQAAAMQRGRTRVQKYLEAGPQTEGQIRDRFKGSTFLTRTGGKVNAPLLVPVFLADLVELGEIAHLHDGRYQLASDARRSA